MIVIVDYGMGNLASIANMIKKVGSSSIISNDQNVVAQADKIILPGVGSFDTGVNKLQETGLIPILNEKAFVQKIPVLGICLGMQLMTKRSEEGVAQGLQWFDADTVKFNFSETNDSSDLKIPHMGWNKIYFSQHRLLNGLQSGDAKFYFVHSYYVKCHDPLDSLITTHYGGEFSSGVAKGNIMGVQFHPEKSHKYGMQLLKNFVDL